MGRPIEPLQISGEQRRELERIANAPTSEQRLARRARDGRHRVVGRGEWVGVSGSDLDGPVVQREPVEAEPHSDACKRLWI